MLSTCISSFLSKDCGEFQNSHVEVFMILQNLHQDISKGWKVMMELKCHLKLFSTSLAWLYLINYQSLWSEEVKLSDKCTAYIMHINNFSIVTLFTAAI